jgi:hypothetical protein
MVEYTLKFGHMLKRFERFSTLLEKPALQPFHTLDYHFKP